jgi:uncharacterized protein
LILNRKAAQAYVLHTGSTAETPGRLLTFVLLLALVSAGAFALDVTKLQPSGYINDFAHVLTPARQQALEAYAANVDRLTGAEFAVVTVDSLDGEPIEDVANNLYRQWGIGKKGKDEGLLLLLSIRDRKQRAEIGYGLEPVIPDGYAGSVLRGIRPILRQGDYGAAIQAALEQFGQRVADSKGVDLNTGLTRQPSPVPPPAIPWPLIVIGIIILLSLLRSSGRRGGGSGAGFLTGMILGNILGAGRRGRYDGGWGGGGFGGYDGGGGGFGGFGGGDSGGGGASSDW